MFAQAAFWLYDQTHLRLELERWTLMSVFSLVSRPMYWSADHPDASKVVLSFKRGCLDEYRTMRSLYRFMYHRTYRFHIGRLELEWTHVPEGRPWGTSFQLLVDEESFVYAFHTQETILKRWFDRVF